MVTLLCLVLWAAGLVIGLALCRVAADADARIEMMEGSDE